LPEILNKTIDIERFIESITLRLALLGIYKWLLLIAPFILIMIGGYIAGAVPDKSATGRLLGSLAERDLAMLLKKNGFSGVKLSVYQFARIETAIVAGAAIPFLLEYKGVAAILLFAAVFFATYKFFYVFLVIKDRARIKRLNMMLPYTIKSIAYLANVYPVNNALIKSIELVPLEFKEDLKELCNDIDDDPISFTPYQRFIDRYDGRLSRLDYYLKTLYRMSKSAGKEELKLLSNLNETISEEMSNARKLKNDAINSRVTYFGLIPVALLTMMLIFLMVVISMSI